MKFFVNGTPRIANAAVFGLSAICDKGLYGLMNIGVNNLGFKSTKQVSPSANSFPILRNVPRVAVGRVYSGHAIY